MNLRELPLAEIHCASPSDLLQFSSSIWVYIVSVASKGKFLLPAGVAMITALLFAHGLNYVVSNVGYSGDPSQIVATRIPRIVTASYSPGSGSGVGSSSYAPAGNVTTNWSGYVSTGGTYTGVSGNWVVPGVAADNSNAMAADATWIGIGGQNSSDLIQIGTQNMVENGQVSSGAFYEGLPGASETVPGVNVSAGDKISASITEVSGGQWAVSISDETNGQSFNDTVSYDSSHTSAEWIEEAPSVSSGVVPLDYFGTVNFSNGTATENGSSVSVSESGAQSIDMASDSGQLLTSTSSANNGSFSVSRTENSSGSAGGYSAYAQGWPQTDPNTNGDFPDSSQWPDEQGSGSPWPRSYGHYSRHHWRQWVYEY
jgi:hypothetical protein